MLTIKLPKSIRIDDLEKILGKAEARVVLEKLAAERQMSKLKAVTPAQYRAAASVVSGTSPGQGTIAALPAMRRFIQEAPGVKNHFLRWCQNQINGAEDTQQPLLAEGDGWITDGPATKTQHPKKRATPQQLAALKKAQDARWAAHRAAKAAAAAPARKGRPAGRASASA